MAELDLAATDTMRDPEEPRSSELILAALAESRKEFQPYWDYCDYIDKLVGAVGVLQIGRGDFFTDQEFDLFWASLEILKPATYCKPPLAVVAPRFADRNKVASVASELLERCINSTFEREDFDETMLEVRDDLIIAARGVIRATYEDGDKKGKRICNDQVDRSDFLHEPARKWQEVGWAAFAAYLDKNAFKKRFPKVDAEKVQYNVRRDKTDNTAVDTVAKCKVWEVWHRADDKVYWVTEGVENVLDEKKPFIDLEGFFPCPRPAYGTRRRRSLIPVPDYVRYERHLDQINILTARIYNLLEWVKVKGIIPAGGDVATAVGTAMANSEDDVLFIPVPSVALMQGAGQFVQFLPVQEFAATVMQLLESRRELINNFYELSGISDIMRGATEAQETLGAQQLKSQYGSVRVREKIDELQRIARDSARITAEILAEKFDQDTLLAMSQMEIPTKAELKKRIKDLEEGAKKELDALEQQAQAAAEQAQASGQQIDPQQAEQQFNQAQQEIIGRTQAQLQAIAKEVPIEDVMSFLRDQKTRAFAIDIETDSTVMVDEMAEKQARGEFLMAFSNASAAVQPLLMAGEPGAKLAGAMLKFSLAPFRAGRELDGLIDDFVDAAPGAMAQQSGGGEGEAAMAEANMQIAQAELKKAEAAIAKVEVDAQSKQQEMMLKAAEAQEKARANEQKFALELESTKGNIAETEARIEKIYAEIQLAQQKLGLEAHREQREDVKTVADIESRQVDQQMNAQNQQRQAIESERNAQMGERQQSFNEQQGTRQQDFTERQADRQQTFAERQAQTEGAE